MKNRTFFNWLIIFLAAVAIVGYCIKPAFADDLDPTPASPFYQEEEIMSPVPFEGDKELQDDKFGLNSQYTWIPIDNFTMWNSSATYNVNSSDYFRYFTNAGYHWLGSGINLPSGAFLFGALVYFYDNHAGDISVFVWRFTSPGNRTLLAQAVSSGTPGYASMWLPIDHTIRNGDGYYVIYVGASTGSANLRIGSVRLAWKRQVRTGLANPFSDIGQLNDRFQNAIKAMAASGITKGCNTAGTLFCPDQVVTRGQMAVFLAEALGLHWDFPY